MKKGHALVIVFAVFSSSLSSSNPLLADSQFKVTRVPGLNPNQGTIANTSVFLNAALMEASSSQDDPATAKDTIATQFEELFFENKDVLHACFENETLDEIVENFKKNVNNTNVKLINNDPTKNTSGIHVNNDQPFFITLSQAGGLIAQATHSPFSLDTLSELPDKSISYGAHFKTNYLFNPIHPEAFVLKKDYLRNPQLYPGITAYLLFITDPNIPYLQPLKGSKTHYLAGIDSKGNFHRNLTCSDTSKSFWTRGYSIKKQITYCIFSTANGSVSCLFNKNKYYGGCMGVGTTPATWLKCPTKLDRTGSTFFCPQP